MGYNLDPLQLDDNLELLNQFLAAVETNTPLLVEVSVGELSNTHYKLNQLLKATEYYPDYAGGKYANLRKNLKLKTSPSGIVVKPYGVGSRVSRAPAEYGDGPAPSVKGGVPSDGSALAYLATYQGKMPAVRFQPSESWNQEQWVSQVEAMGYIVHGFQKDEQGMIVAAVERRQEQRSAFDLLRG